MAPRDGASTVAGQTRSRESADHPNLALLVVVVGVLITAIDTTIVVLVCVPITSSTSCDQVILVDHATDVSLFSDAVQVEVDRLG
jgi:hypothetical protein